jgi:hypothetical protein
MTTPSKAQFKRPPGLEAFIREPINHIVKNDVASEANLNNVHKDDIGINNDTNTNIDDIAPTVKIVEKKYVINDGRNPRSIKRKVFNVRLNAYYLEALRSFSNPEEGTSMQKVAREILEKGLDEMLLKTKK